MIGVNSIGLAADLVTKIGPPVLLSYRIKPDALNQIYHARQLPNRALLFIYAWYTWYTHTHNTRQHGTVLRGPRSIPC